MRIPLVGSSYKGVSVALDSQSTINLMEEFADSKEANAPSALVATPGLGKLNDSTDADLSFTGFPITGLFDIPDTSGFTQSALVVAGENLYFIAPDGPELLTNERMRYVKTSVGTVPGATGTTPTIVSFANSSLQVVIAPVHGRAYVYTLASGALSAAIVFDATPGSYVEIAQVVFIAGYFLAIVNGSSTGFLRRIYYSTINDGSTWSSADYFNVENTSDFVKTLKVKNDQLWVFTDNVVVRFQSTGDANNPFAPILGSTISQGCIDADSVCEVDDYFMWLGSNHGRSGLVVYRSNGGAAERVSRGFAESRIQKIFEDEGWMGIDDLVCTSGVERGHVLYKMHFHRGKTTLVYDATTNKWHERGWWNVITGEYEEEIGYLQIDLNHTAVVGDRRLNLDEGVSGIYELSERLTSNDVFYQNTAAHTAGTDTFIRRERISPTFSNPNGQLLSCSELELLFETGKANANDPGSEPKIMLYISRDGGNTWGNPRVRSIGKVGKFKDRCLFFGLGSAYRMTFKLVMSDPIGWKLISAIADWDLAA